MVNGKAGLFAGEVTQNAPADRASTTKHKGYQWMQWGLEQSVDELITAAVPIAMYTFQDASFATNVIDVVGVYDVRTSTTKPSIAYDQWRSTNTQYGKFPATVNSDAYDPTDPAYTGNLLFDMFGPADTDQTITFGFRSGDAGTAFNQCLLASRANYASQKFSIVRSPASASFGLFRDYKDRAEKFKQAVEEV